MNFWPGYALKLTIAALVLAGLCVLARRLGRARLLACANYRFVTVLESTMLSQQLSLHVVKVGTRYLFVGGGNAGVATLAELAPHEVDAWLARRR